MSEDELDAQSCEFARRASGLLKASASELPASIRSRLTRARHVALVQSRRRIAWRAWLPAGAAAAAVLTVLLLQGPSALPQAASGASEDFDMLADSSAFALVQDQLAQGGDVDYEFYDWAVNAADDERAEAGS